MSSPRAIILDFDGVVLESADIKTRAFAALFADHPDHVDAIVELHLRLAGVSRYDKFQLIYDEILERPLRDGELDELGERFSAIALEQVLACEFVPGARTFIEGRSGQHLLFIASGTPDEELRHIVSERGLMDFFTGVHGTPATKGEIVKRILAEHSLDEADALFVGDATTDLEGAREGGIAFVGRLPADGTNPFEGEPVPVVADMAELDRELERLLPQLGVYSA